MEKLRPALKSSDLTPFSRFWKRWDAYCCSQKSVCAPEDCPARRAEHHGYLYLRVMGSCLSSPESCSTSIGERVELSRRERAARVHTGSRQCRCCLRILSNCQPHRLLRRMAQVLIGASIRPGKTFAARKNLDGTWKRKLRVCRYSPCVSACVCERGVEDTLPRLDKLVR